MSGQDVFIRFYYESEQEKPDNLVNVAFNVRSSQGYLLANLNSVDTGQSHLDIKRRGYFECRWPKFNLRSGNYDCALFCSINGDVVDWLQNAFMIKVEDGDYYKTGKLVDRQQGDILVDCSWASGGCLPDESMTAGNCS
jgi:lipopolysaccharide transport system ATP-binding protein